jgi:hypothetical protein
MPAVRSLPRSEMVELKDFLESELSTPVASSRRMSDETQSDLFEQLAAAAPYFFEPVTVSPEGLIALEQLLAEVTAKNQQAHS